MACLAIDSRAILTDAASSVWQEDLAIIQGVVQTTEQVWFTQDLKHRYGNPLVVLNLVKRNEKRPREMWLGREFEAAIEYANKQVSCLTESSVPRL